MASSSAVQDSSVGEREADGEPDGVEVGALVVPLDPLP